MLTDYLRLHSQSQEELEEGGKNKNKKGTNQVWKELSIALLYVRAGALA